jgi:hypothetical protein
MTWIVSVSGSTSLDADVGSQFKAMLFRKADKRSDMGTTGDRQSLSKNLKETFFVFLLLPIFSESTSP